MRIKLFLITGIMGLAVISGIIKGLSSKRDGSGKQEGEKAGGKEELSYKEADL